MIETKNMGGVVMIQPNTSLTGSFIRMLPLGVLYASSKIIKDGFSVDILDTRVVRSSWKEKLAGMIKDDTLVVGLSVMSGYSIIESVKISRFVKEKWPAVKVVWGGPHPTFSPDDVLLESAIDFAISGYGAEPFRQLMQNLINSEQALPFEQINGLSWRDENGLVHINKATNSFEFIHYEDIPYDLIENFQDYKHIDTDEKVFPMYSVMGCPYKCSFCSSPAQYSNIKKKWEQYPLEEIVEHIKFVKEKYGATFVYFIDDDSFVNLKHVEGIIDQLNEDKIKIKLGFRGARINEIIKMSDQFLEKLAAAGTNTMHIGIESGSNRLLKLMKKNTTVEQIVKVNQKLARHPEITVFYNFIVGYPTETLEETKQTRDLILRLVQDNPTCCVIPLNKPRPLPGTELYELAVSFGYQGPKTLEGWGEYDVESSDYRVEWLTEEHNKFIRMMFLCMYFIDNKILQLSKGRSLKYTFLKIMAALYKPVATFRFKYGIDKLLIEDIFYSFFNWLIKSSHP